MLVDAGAEAKELGLPLPPHATYGRAATCARRRPGPRRSRRPRPCAALKGGGGALRRGPSSGDGGADRSGRSGHDPSARQFVPASEAELDTAARSGRPHRRRPPTTPVAGLVHRYPDRVPAEADLHLRHLLPVLLRPREWWGRKRVEAPDRRGAATRPSPISPPDAEVREVILSGGDPSGAVAAPPEGRSWGASAALDHVKAIRFHTRVPVVDPGAGDADQLIAGPDRAPGKAVYVALHANHARELTHAAAPPAPAWSTPACPW